MRRKVMNENTKLENIRKSCNVGEKVANVFCVIAIVGCVFALVAGIAILNMGREFDDKVEAASVSGNVTFGNTLGGFKLLNVDLSDPSNLESDIPAVQEAIKDHPYSISFSISCFGLAIMAAIMAAMTKLAGSVFSLIRKEDNPFTDKVIKRVLAVMIALSVILFFTSGMGQGILCGILTWVVYTILDYGKMLQVQSDETL